MNLDEIKILRHLPTFASRPHFKSDLLGLLNRSRVRVVTCDLDDLRHFSVFSQKEKISFFDYRLSDAEFTERGFRSFVFHVLGGNGTNDLARLSASSVAKTDRIVRRIIAPEFPVNTNAEIRLKSPRRHHHIVSPLTAHRRAA